MYTWSFAYNIEGIRDWLFEQTKAEDVLKKKAPAGMDAKQHGKDGAHKGSPQGKTLLNTGIAYLYGQDGATDYDVARECFQKAWNDGNMKAGRYLGLMAANGLGEKQSDAQAAQWYDKAQQKGDTTSMYLLGKCYEQGKGVKQNYAKARSLYEKSGSAHGPRRRTGHGLLGRHVRQRPGRSRRHGQGQSLVPESRRHRQPRRHRSAQANVAVRRGRPKVFPARQVLTNGRHRTANGMDNRGGRPAWLVKPPLLGEVAQKGRRG